MPLGNVQSKIHAENRIGGKIMVKLHNSIQALKKVPVADAKARARREKKIAELVITRGVELNERLRGLLMEASPSDSLKEMLFPMGMSDSTSCQNCQTQTAL